MLCGTKQRIEDVLRFKSNMDSGMFLPLQMAAAKALTLGENWHEQLNEIYRKRRQKVFELLDELDCIYDKEQAGLFVWARVPSSYKSGHELSDKLLSDTRVFITPGGIFGTAGENYVRVSLCTTEEKFEEALKRISKISIQQGT